MAKGTLPSTTAALIYRIDNSGSFIKRGTVNDHGHQQPDLFSSTGSLDVQSGTLQFNFNTALSGAITGGERIAFVGGTHTLPAGTLFDATTLNLSMWTFNLGIGVAPQLSVVDVNASTFEPLEDRSFSTLSIRGDGRFDAIQWRG
jgi:hypothetical protein